MVGSRTMAWGRCDIDDVDARLCCWEEDELVNVESIQPRGK